MLENNILFEKFFILIFNFVLKQLLKKPKAYSKTFRHRNKKLRYRNFLSNFKTCTMIEQHINLV